MSSLSLLELNQAIQATLSEWFDQTYWVTAEVSEARVANNGHCYLEFIEKDERSQMVLARAKANIWRNTYLHIAEQFKAATGTTIQAGMTILAEVSVTFHPVYGYALNVHHIDPTYTLGDIAKQRQKILQQLEEEGIIDDNKRLSLPRPLKRIAVVSSASAAGYGDFMHQLQQSGYPFECTLFPAIMQGDGVEESCMAALYEIFSKADEWDCVVIIRGGGAAADLYGFERYDLAAVVAQFPIPVLTGIGHERDETVLDYVAHTRLKTPTAVAAFLIEHFSAECALLDDLSQRLVRGAMDYINRERRRQEQLSVALANCARRCLIREDEVLKRMKLHVAMLCRQRLHREQQKLPLLEKIIALAQPSHILSQGYSITRINGKAITDAQQLKAGDIVTTTFSHGTAQSQIITPQPEKS